MSNADQDSTIVTLDILTGAPGSESPEALAQKLKALIENPFSALYNGAVARWIDPSSFEINFLEDDSQKGGADVKLSEGGDLKRIPEQKPLSDQKVGSGTDDVTHHSSPATEDAKFDVASEPSTMPIVDAVGPKVPEFAVGAESAVEPKNPASMPNPLTVVGNPLPNARDEHGLPNKSEIRRIEQLEAPRSAADVDRLLRDFPSKWECAWMTSKMMRTAKSHKGRNVGMRNVTLEHRKRVDMLSGDPHLIRQHAISAFLTLLAPEWRARLIYGELTKELIDARSHGSALRNSSYGTEIALSAAANSMDHLLKSLSKFLVEFTLALIDASDTSEPRFLSTQPPLKKEDDDSELMLNRALLTRWCDRLVSAIIDSGPGSLNFQLVINSYFVAVSNKFTPATSPRTPPPKSGGIASESPAQKNRRKKEEKKRRSHQVSKSIDIGKIMMGEKLKGRKTSKAEVLGVELMGEGTTAAAGESKTGGLQGKNDQSASDQVLRLLGGFLFLRLLNPKLLQPSGLLVPPGKGNDYNARMVLEALESNTMQANLKVMCKVLMTLSNGKLYTAVNQLAFLNPWLLSVRKKMDGYINQFCKYPPIQFDPDHGQNRRVYHQRRQLLEDLREYLLLLLPVNEYEKGKDTTPEDLSIEIMPGPSRQGKDRRGYSEQETKINHERTVKTFVTMASLVMGLEKLFAGLNTKKLLGVDAKEFDERSHIIVEEGMDGNPYPEFTLSAYAPRIFTRLQLLFGVTPERMLYSMAINLPHADFIHNTKKKGSAYLYTYDKRFIVKTQSEPEFKNFLGVLRPYYHHIRDNRNSILARVLGMYELQSQGKATYLVVMANVCYGQQILQSRYDLKATNDRRASDQERTQRVRVLKDSDFQSSSGLQLAHAGGKVMSQLKNDIRWLTKHRIQGYRLMVGIYVDRTMESQREIFEQDGHCGHYGLMKDQCLWALNRANFKRDATLKKQRMFVERMSRRLRKNFHLASVEKKAELASQSSTLRDSTIFHGIPSTPVERKGSMRKRVVYIGIIDMMREYNTRRKLENFWKTHVIREGEKHSAIPPKAYGERMIQFVTNNLKW